jgi:hypothetical protein
MISPDKTVSRIICPEALENSGLYEKFNTINSKLLKGLISINQKSIYHKPRRLLCLD